MVLQSWIFLLALFSPKKTFSLVKFQGYFFIIFLFIVSLSFFIVKYNDRGLTLKRLPVNQQPLYRRPEQQMKIKPVLVWFCEILQNQLVRHMLRLY